MNTIFDGVPLAADNPSRAVQAVELARGGTPKWSMLSVPEPVRALVMNNLPLTLCCVVALLGLTAWLWSRRYGLVGAAGTLLLAGLMVRGHLLSVRRVYQQSRAKKISLAAAVLAED